MHMDIRKNYRNDDALRGSFNRLAEETFGLNFENWYQNGYWSDNYNPYSVVIDGQIAANISVNRINMMWDGQKKLLIQLGTVMTAKKYRNQGMIRALMEEIEKDYSGKCDGMFLFANDSVLDLYPKFGFQKAEEYQYGRLVTGTSGRTVVNVPMQEKGSRDALLKAIEGSQAFYGFDMIENSGLYMFYLSQFMQENVYLYGAGRHAVECMDYFEACGVKIDSFLVTKKNGNPEKIRDYPVYQADDYVKNKKVFIVIAIMSDKINEIKRYLDLLNENEFIQYVEFI